MTSIFRWLLAGTATLLLAVPATSAHPGRTDASGCHTCRTNCSKWGLRTGQYHCSGGGRRSGISRIPPRPPIPPAAANPQTLLRPSKQTAGIPVEVRTVVDGDTFVGLQAGRLYLMTLRDVEAPEFEQPDGPAAREHLASRIAGKRILVWPAKPDGCLVPVLAQTLDGADVAELLLVEGSVWAGRTAPESWRRLEAMARRKRVGLWIGLQPEPPWEFRARRTMARESIRP